MHPFLSCPQCQARLRVPADAPQAPVRCIACGSVFTLPSDEPQVLDAIPVEDTRIQLADAPPRPRLPQEEGPKPAVRAGCFLHGLALTPLLIPLLAIPFCRFGAGWIAGVLWGILGLGLALACVGLVRRTQWGWVTRLLMTLGLTGAGQVLLLGALAVSFWMWLYRIDPAAWHDFAPPGGRFHVSLPGTPLQRPATGQGLPPGYQVYELELHRQDVSFAISYGDVPLQEWRQLRIQVRFDKSRDGMIANLPGSRVVAEKRIALNHNPGREYHLKVASKGVVVARVYFVRNRLYVLVIGGSRITPDSEDVRKFLDSFQPDPLDEKAFPPLRPEQQPPDIEDEDIYPGRKILGHEKHPVRRLVVSRDGSTVAAGCEDNTIELWNLSSGKGLGKLTLQPGFHRPFFRPDFDISPDGKMLAAAVPGGGFKLFDMTTQKESATLLAGKNPDEAAMLDAQGVGPGRVSAIAFSPSGRYLAGNYTAGGRLEIRVWDVAARKLLRSIHGHKAMGSVMAFTPDGRYLVNGGQDGTIRWFDPLTGSEVKHLTPLGDKPGQKSPVTALAFTADGGTLAVSYWRVLHLVDVRTGGNRVVLQHGGVFVAMDISANGRFLVTGTDNGELRVSETATGKQRWLQPGVDLGRNEPAHGLAFTPDGKRLVLYRGQRLEVWDLDQMIEATPEELAEPKDRPAIEEPEPSSPDRVTRIEAHVRKDRNALNAILDRNNPDAQQGVIAMGLSTDGKTLFTTGRDRSLRFWDLASGEKRAEASVDVMPVGLAVSADGKTVAVADPFVVYLHDVATGQRRDILRPEAPAAALKKQSPDTLKKINAGSLFSTFIPESILTLAFTPDGQTLAVVCGGGIELWDLAAKKVRRRLVPEARVGHIVFSPDGRTLAICNGDWSGNDPFVRLYEVSSGKLVAKLVGFTGHVSDVAYSADGKYLAAAGGGTKDSQILLVWDANTAQELKRFEQPTRYKSALVFSPDGKSLAWAQGGRVDVYDFATGQEFATFSVGAGSLLFSRDSRILMAGSGDGDVELWNLARLPRPQAPAVAGKPPPRPLATGKDLQHIGNVEPFLAVAVDPKASRALFLGRDRFLRVYSYPDFKPERAYWLGVTAYKPALDSERGMLYAAVCDTRALDYLHIDPVGGLSDLQVYDVKKILAGENVPEHVLRPAAMVPLNAKVTDLLCTPDNRWIFYQTIDDRLNGLLGRIDARTRAKERETAGGALCCSRDGQTIYLGRKDEIQVFDAATMKQRGSIEVPMAPGDIAVNDDLLFLTDRRTLGVVDLRPDKPVFLGASGTIGNSRVYAGIAPRRVYVAGTNGIPNTISAYEFPEKKPIAKNQWLPPVDSIRGGGELLGEVSITPDGKYLLCRTGTVLRLALPGIQPSLPEPAENAGAPIEVKGLPWRERAPLTAPKKSFFHALAIFPDGKMLMAGGSDGMNCMYERESGRLLNRAGDGLSGDIGYMAFSPDGKTLTCTYLNRRARIFNVSRGGLRLVQPFSLAGYGRDAVAYTPDSGEVAIAGDKVTVANVRDQQGKEVVICKANDGQVAKAVRGFTDPLTAVALSRDGKRLAVGSITGLVHQVDMSNPSQRRALTGHSAEARCVAYAPDGKLLASGGVDATVRLWDPDTGKEVRKLSGHTNVVLCLVFSPDGKTLVTGGADGTVRVWDVATGKEGGVIPPRRPGTMVYALAFTPDGKGLAAACGAEVRQWDIGK